MPLPLREAAGIEGLIVLGVIYFVLNLLQKAGQKAARSRPSAQPSPAEAEPSGTQQEALSLESILREIEKVKTQHRPETPASRPAPTAPKRQAPPRRSSAGTGQAPRRSHPATDPERGPLGRHAGPGLRSHEEVEERASFDDGMVPEVVRSESEAIAALERKRSRVEVDQDDEAEAIVQRRIREAEARNQPHSARDHAKFDAEVRAPADRAAAGPRFAPANLRQAFIWREILGPPKALE